MYKRQALDLAEKGETQALIVNEQGKLLKAQRQLGALVYSLAQGKDENQPLVDRYIAVSYTHLMCIRDRIVTWEKLCEAIKASGRSYNMEMIEKAYNLANTCLLYTSISFIVRMFPRRISPFPAPAVS